ncbi:MAG TPA: DUF4382 domain-containing protein [Cyclobacteriaceae bacterium]|nr:DUF4382 domain-containing protein [Cyclobacteriaceae bacterium]
MKKKIVYFLTGIASIVLMAFLFSACSDDSKNARIEVRLTDAPGDYDEVNIDIQEVEVHTNGGWTSLDIIPGVYNLLDFTNGLDTLMGSLVVPEGELSQIRLILGDNNTIKVDGEVFDLATPSSQQSGLKLNVHTLLQGGLTYRFLLDFEVAKSIIVLKGNGGYSLKPVIRVVTEATSGGISGTVSIPESTPAVYAIIDLDTLGTSFADSTGGFFIGGLPAGSYRVSFAPATGYTIPDKTLVPVTVGNVTDIGVVEVTVE